MTRRIAGFGWRPQMGDHRDRVFNLEETVLTGSQLPTTGGRDPSTLPPIWDQRHLGSCVPHGSLRAYLATAMAAGQSLPMLSRLFVYAKGRELEGTPLTDDSGMEVRDAIKVLAKYGAPPETDWPYTDANPGPFQQEPSAVAASDALQHLAIKYQSIIVGPGAPMRTALHNGLVIPFGFPVPNYFEDPSVWDPASEQPLPLPGPNTRYIGGHCVALTAYNFAGRFVSGAAISHTVRPYFTADNSWSSAWGMAGRFNIDARFFDPWRQLASDLWVIQADT